MNAISNAGNHFNNVEINTIRLKFTWLHQASDSRVEDKFKYWKYWYVNNEFHCNEIRDTPLAASSSQNTLSFKTSYQPEKEDNKYLPPKKIPGEILNVTVNEMIYWNILGGKYSNSIQ